MALAQREAGVVPFAEEHVQVGAAEAHCSDVDDGVARSGSGSITASTEIWPGPVVIGRASSASGPRDQSADCRVEPGGALGGRVARGQVIRLDLDRQRQPVRRVLEEAPERELARAGYEPTMAGLLGQVVGGFRGCVADLQVADAVYPDERLRTLATPVQV